MERYSVVSYLGLICEDIDNKNAILWMTQIMEEEQVKEPEKWVALYKLCAKHQIEIEKIFFPFNQPSWAGRYKVKLRG